MHACTGRCVHTGLHRSHPTHVYEICGIHTVPIKPKPRGKMQWRCCCQLHCQSTSAVAMREIPLLWMKRANEGQHRQSHNLRGTVPHHLGYPAVCRSLVWSTLCALSVNTVAATTARNGHIWPPNIDSLYGSTSDLCQLLGQQCPMALVPCVPSL
jgi:hypothetical protein